MVTQKSIRRKVGLIVALIFINPLAVGMAQAQDPCETALREAEQNYYAGQFDQAIARVNGCLNKSGLAKEEKIKAYKLLSLICIAQENLEQARSNIRKLLELEPNYAPDPAQDSKEFVELIAKMKEQQPRLQPPPPSETPPRQPLPQKSSVKKGGSRKWLWIGAGGLAAAGATAAILLGGGNKGEPPPQPFPLPPGRPR